MPMREWIQQAAELTGRVGHMLIPTAGSDGWAHLATAGAVGPDGKVRLAVSAWFCPGIVANVQDNPKVSLVVWDPATDEGLQLLGQVERVEEMAVMDGFMPSDKPDPMPQVERALHVRVGKVYRFRRGPHSDTEIGAD